MPLAEVDGQLVVTIEVDESGYFDLANAALYIGRSKSYTRILWRKGKIEAVVDADGNPSFHREALDAYLAQPARGGRKAGDIPYRTLSSVGKKLRAAMLMVSASECDDNDKQTTLHVLQELLSADIAKHNK